MKNLYLLLFILLIITACRTRQTQLDVLEYTLPVKIDDDWKKASEKLGKPDRSGANFFTFYQYGIIIYTDAAHQKITSIIATWFERGIHFTGKIYGIGLGDTLPKCRRLWGQEQRKESKSEDYYLVVWKLEKRTLEVEFWSQGGNDVDLGGAYEADTVKRIKIT
ncbi:MAG: hypothetical protein N2167_03185 [Flavobacteriales bacterium]|nr:hypothetical protein [Flavobacteriales bacterium]